MLTRPIIRTPDQRLRVFVSSTLKELAAERQAVRDAILRMHLAPVMFELGARPHDARDLYRAYLEQSHIFVGIYAEEYGWVGPGMSVSGLEEEYELARPLPRLIYIRSSAPNRDPRLAALLARIRDRDGLAYKRYGGVEELASLVSADLGVLLSETFESARQSAASRAPGQPLPVPPYPIVGRQREVEDLQVLLRGGARVATLTGPGGVGKTRLSIEAARVASSDYQDVFFAELAAVTDGNLVAGTIARAMGLRETAQIPAEAMIVQRLAEDRVLLVVDNTEQIPDAGAVIARIIAACPRLQVLVTSRMALRIRGEVEFPVAPLALDPAGDDGVSAAVAMFIARAQAIRPDLDATPEGLTAIREICDRLEGLPLAIELAAARVRSLPPAAILRRLEQRLPLLAAGPADLPSRQRTMRDTIAWSYDLLSPAEATLLRRLAVFADGARLDAIEKVCALDEATGSDPLAILDGLVAKSLLFVNEDLDGEPRFDMFETIREFARERLVASGEENDTLARHAHYFAALGEEAEPHLTSGRRDSWMQRLDGDLDNVRAVLSRSLSRAVDPVLGIRLGGTLGWYWHLRGHLREGRRWATELSQLPEATLRGRLRARILFPAGGLAWSMGDYEACNRILEESALIFEEAADMRGLTDSTGILAGSLANVGQFDRARSLCLEMERRLREADDRWGLAFTLYWLGSIILVHDGDAGAARACYEEILTIAEHEGDGWLRAEALNHLGVATGLQAEHDLAIRYFEESIAYHERTGDRWAVARGLSDHALVLLRGGQIDDAKALLKRSLRLWREMGNELGVSICLGGLAMAAAASGDLGYAARLAGAAGDPVRSVGFLFVKGGVLDPVLIEAKSTLGDEVWEREFAIGRQMSGDAAITLALGAGSDQPEEPTPA